MILKPWRSQKFLKYVRTLPCSHCLGKSDDPHHIIGVDRMGTMGGKTPDLAAVPLCRKCHRAVHNNPTMYPQTRWVIETLNRALQEGVLDNKYKDLGRE